MHRQQRLSMIAHTHSKDASQEGVAGTVVRNVTPGARRAYIVGVASHPDNLILPHHLKEGKWARHHSNYDASLLGYHPCLVK